MVRGACFTSAVDCVHLDFRANWIAQAEVAMIRQPMHRAANLRRRLYEVLEHGPIGDRLGRITARLIVALIMVNLAAVALESVPDYGSRYGTLFLAIETVSLVLFTVEYALRVWVAAEHAPQRHLTK